MLVAYSLFSNKTKRPLFSPKIKRYQACSATGGLAAGGWGGGVQADPTDRPEGPPTGATGPRAERQHGPDLAGSDYLTGWTL